MPDNADPAAPRGSAPRRRALRAGLAAGFAALLAGFAAPGPTAVDQLQRLQAALAADKGRGDWTTYLADAERQRVLLNGSPLATLEVARAELRLGHVAAALAETRRFVAMGQTSALIATPLFAPVRAGTLGAAARNAAPIGEATEALAVGDQGLVAEDIDEDARSGRFFLTSILEHRIVALEASGAARTFASAPDAWPMLAVKIDAARRRLWATEVALAAFAAVRPADKGRSAVLEYDLDHGTLLSRTEGPPHASLGDMALDAAGQPLVSDGEGGGVYRLTGGRLVRIDHGEFISPQTPAPCPGGHVAFVPDYVRGLAKLDLGTGAVRWLSGGGRHALSGIDGLYCAGRSLVAVQNGASPPRVIVFTLDARGAAIVGERIIERAPDGDFTHGVFVGRRFFYIADAGWNALDDAGRPKASPPLTGAKIRLARWTAPQPA